MTPRSLLAYAPGGTDNRALVWLVVVKAMGLSEGKRMCLVLACGVLCSCLCSVAGGTSSDPDALGGIQDYQTTNFVRSLSWFGRAKSRTPIKSAQAGKPAPQHPRTNHGIPAFSRVAAHSGEPRGLGRAKAAILPPDAKTLFERAGRSVLRGMFLTSDMLRGGMNGTWQWFIQYGCPFLSRRG